jgi:hypothetical protein
MPAEMTGVIIDQACAALEREIAECGVVALETVELNHMAGLALIVRDRFQIEIGALVFLMAIGA